MLQKDQTILPKDSHLDGLPMTTRHKRGPEPTPQTPSNSALFTNQAILTSLTKADKNMKLKRISSKKPAFQENSEFGQLLKISTLATNIEKQQKLLESQNISHPHKTTKPQHTKTHANRPKSAICLTNPFTQFKIPQQQPLSIHPHPKQAQVLLQINSNQGKKVSKEHILKEKILSKISLFTSNPNVFIPRTSKNYGSYLNQSKLDQSKLKSRQESSPQNQLKLKRNTVSHINQKELYQKCRQIINLDGWLSRGKNGKSIKRKKINFARMHSQLSKLANTVCSESFLKLQDEQTKIESNPKSNNKSFSQHICLSNEPLLKDSSKVFEAPKKRSGHSRNLKKVNSKYRHQTKNKQTMTLYNDQKHIQPSLYIESVELKVDGCKKQQQYYRVSFPSNFQRNEISMLSRKNYSTTHLSGHQQNPKNNNFQTMPSRETFHV